VRKLKSDGNRKVAAFKAVARRYWMTLGDGASDRPYAAGQLTLNNAVTSVQNLATTKHWTVAQGVATPSTANPTYKPWLPYTP
jgi:hypothetical protein